MTTTFRFDPKTRQLTGPAGTLPIPATDLLAPRFLMLMEGQCLQEDITSLTKKYGFSRPRYYQLLADFKQGGLSALQPQKTGPKSNYRRTDQAVRQVLRYRFLDPEASADVIAQQLRQTHFPISLRSVQRILADYGLQKKHLVHEAALCRNAVRADRSLRHKGFELLNGWSWLPTDSALHDLLEAHTIAEAQRLQVRLGQLRRAGGHFPGPSFALDPHRLVSFFKRDLVQRRPSAKERAGNAPAPSTCISGWGK